MVFMTAVGPAAFFTALITASTWRAFWEAASGGLLGMRRDADVDLHAVGLGGHLRIAGDAD